jgi:NADPH:quinone reductase
MLNPGGACVVYGVADGDMAPVPVPAFMRTGGARLVGFFLYQTLRREPAGIGLAKLLTLAGDGRVRPVIELEAPWTEIATLAPKVLDRTVAGKVVLRVGDLA